MITNYIMLQLSNYNYNYFKNVINYYYNITAGEDDPLYK